MAQPESTAISSGLRRRKLTLLLALLLGSIAIGIGGSMYYQQQKAKAAALAAESGKQADQQGSTGTVAGDNTALPDTSATPPLAENAGEAAKPEDTLAPKLAQKQQRKAKPAAKKTDDTAEQLLTSNPTAAGTPAGDAPAPGSLAAALEPGQVAAPAQTDAPSLANNLLEANPTAAGAGDAPAPNNTTAPAGTAGLPPGGGITPTTPVPEPSTWLMMLGALGLLAAGMRRQQQ